MITGDDIAKQLKTESHLDFYSNYYSLDTAELAKALDEILKDKRELDAIRDNLQYRDNVVDMVQFIYSKFLAERKEQQPTVQAKTTRKASLFSPTFLEKLYTFAA